METSTVFWSLGTVGVEAHWECFFLQECLPELQNYNIQKPELNPNIKHLIQAHFVMDIYHSLQHERMTRTWAD